ncbi:hypothetical protein [Streptomyces sp. NPDC050538]|uniref:hypothetical protein n=1 Tax=Streptomyces sp. NPDC050538 TaxID=3365627 RepID=UPI0037AA2967
MTVPADRKAFDVLAERIAAAATPEVRDVLLDQWLDYRDRATEWDARRWGFDPDRWLEKERAELSRRSRFGRGDVQLDDAL